jgi:RNA polymerase sigma-70 factor (ECF subfamily)
MSSPATIRESGVEPFEVFYRREYRSVVGLTLVLGGDRWSAEDVTQEAFLAAEQQWDRVGRLDNPGAWVRKVVANKAVSRWRRRGAEVRALTKLGRSANPGSVGDDPEFSAATAEVWEAVRALPRRQALALALTYLEDCSLEQVAEVLGCAPGTVKTHLRRGRAAVAKQLGVTEEGLGHVDR